MHCFGDETQLLAARFRKPWPIIAGILVATLLNRALAGWLGAMSPQWLSPAALLFLALTGWVAWHGLGT